ncbi:uncharacterized protein LOC144477079 isoform X2 [Augochlora pura]
MSLIHLTFSVEKIRKIDVQQNLDFSNERSIQNFIKENAGFFDKLNSLSNKQILTSHLNNINTRILQKTKAKKRNIENIKKMELKVSNKNISCKEKVRATVRHKLRESKTEVLPRLERDKNIHRKTNTKSKSAKAVIENNNKFCNESTRFDSYKSIYSFVPKYGNRKTLIKNNWLENLIDVTKEEIETARKILWFHAKDTEFLRRKLHVSLYIAKNKDYDVDTSNRMIYNQILCHHAILCLIEPSDKVFVLVEDDLTFVIKKYLSQGYNYHFEYQRDSQNYFTALIILNHWAKVLIQHSNTMMMRTICGILGCDIHQILVLHGP